MTNPYPLERALEVIKSINLNAMTTGEAIYYAKKTADKGLKQYREQITLPTMKSQLLEDINDGRIQGDNQR